MIWEELLLPHWREETELAQAFGAALHLDPEQIVVVDDVAAAVGRVTPATPLLLQHNPVEGDVRQLVAAFPRRSELEAGDEWAILRAICRHLHETCLVPDEGQGETYFAVEPDGAVQRVQLDEDDSGVFCIVSRLMPVKKSIPA